LTTDILVGCRKQSPTCRLLSIAMPALYLRPIELGDINWPLQGANCQQ